MGNSPSISGVQQIVGPAGENAGVDVRFEYFAAPGDAEAAATIDLEFGSGSAEPLETSAATPETAVTTVITASDIDPVVQMASLEELLTEHTFEEIRQDPRSGLAVAIRNGGNQVVAALTDSLAAKLSLATMDELALIAEDWARTEEFWGEADPVDLMIFLGELASLAASATAANHRLYCRINLDWG